MTTIGLIADRYRVERELGKGSFGTTYLVRDLVTDRQLAVKLADPDTEFTERFRSEAVLLRKVNNPHVACIVDFGVFESRPYLAMEYVSGPTLRELLDEDGRLPVAAAIETLRAVATGLSAAHDQNIIHRDLKPANVILRGNSCADAVLIDFGVAGTIGSHGLTRAGQMFGTIFHMAPEQVQGLPQSTATDVYGAGILLYWMLFGKQPFEGDSIAAIFSKILTQEPEIPFDSEIPDALRLLLVRCLAKDPVLRPHSAHELLVELDRVQHAVAAFESKTQTTAMSMPAAAVPAKSAAIGSPLGSSGDVARKYNAQRATGFPFRRASVGFAIVVTAVLIFVWIGLRSGALSQTGRTLAATLGILLTLAGIPLGLVIRKWLRNRRSGIDDEATRLLFGAKSRDMLTETLAIEVDRLIRQLDRLDDRILGISIAIMVQEFRTAKQTDARQKALMQMVELLEKVRYRLTPWYVRHEKLIAIVVSVLTCLSGAATAAANILKPAVRP